MIDPKVPIMMGLPKVHTPDMPSATWILNVCSFLQISKEIGPDIKETHKTLLTQKTDLK